MGFLDQNSALTAALGNMPSPTKESVSSLLRTLLSSLDANFEEYPRDRGAILTSLAGSAADKGAAPCKGVVGLPSYEVPLSLVGLYTALSTGLAETMLRVINPESPIERALLSKFLPGMTNRETRRLARHTMMLTFILCHLPENLTPLDVEGTQLGQMFPGADLVLLDKAASALLVIDATSSREGLGNKALSLKAAATPVAAAGFSMVFMGINLDPIQANAQADAWVFSGKESAQARAISGLRTLSAEAHERLMNDLSNLIVKTAQRTVKEAPALTELPFSAERMADVANGMKASVEEAEAILAANPGLADLAQHYTTLDPSGDQVLPALAIDSSPEGLEFREHQAALVAADVGDVVILPELGGCPAVAMGQGYFAVEPQKSTGRSLFALDQPVCADVPASFSAERSPAEVASAAATIRTADTTLYSHRGAATALMAPLVPSAMQPAVKGAIAFAEKVSRDVDAAQLETMSSFAAAVTQVGSGAMARGSRTIASMCKRVPKESDGYNLLRSWRIGENYKVIVLRHTVAQCHSSVFTRTAGPVIKQNPTMAVWVGDSSRIVGGNTSLIAKNASAWCVSKPIYCSKARIAHWMQGISRATIMAHAMCSVSEAQMDQACQCISRAARLQASGRRHSALLVKVLAQLGTIASSLRGDANAAAAKAPRLAKVNKKMVPLIVSQIIRIAAVNSLRDAGKLDALLPESGLQQLRSPGPAPIICNTQLLGAQVPLANYMYIAAPDEGGVGSNMEWMAFQEQAAIIKASQDELGNACDPTMSPGLLEVCEAREPTEADFLADLQWFFSADENRTPFNSSMVVVALGYRASLKDIPTQEQISKIEFRAMSASVGSIATNKSAAKAREVDKRGRVRSKHKSYEGTLELLCPGYSKRWNYEQLIRGLRANRGSVDSLGIAALLLDANTPAPLAMVAKIFTLEKTREISMITSGQRAGQGVVEDVFKSLTKFSSVSAISEGNKAAVLRDLLARAIDGDKDAIQILISDDMAKFGPNASPRGFCGLLGALQFSDYFTDLALTTYNSFANKQAFAPDCIATDYMSNPADFHNRHSKFIDQMKERGCWDVAEKMLSAKGAIWRHGMAQGLLQFSADAVRAALGEITTRALWAAGFPSYAKVTSDDGVRIVNCAPGKTLEQRNQDMALIEEIMATVCPLGSMSLNRIKTRYAMANFELNQTYIDQDVVREGFVRSLLNVTEAPLPSGIGLSAVEVSSFCNQAITEGCPAEVAFTALSFRAHMHGLHHHLPYKVVFNPLGCVTVGTPFFDPLAAAVYSPLACAAASVTRLHAQNGKPLPYSPGDVVVNLASSIARQLDILQRVVSPLNTIRAGEEELLSSQLFADSYVTTGIPVLKPGTRPSLAAAVSSMSKDGSWATVRNASTGGKIACDVIMNILGELQGKLYCPTSPVWARAMCYGGANKNGIVRVTDGNMVYLPKEERDAELAKPLTFKKYEGAHVNAYAAPFAFLVSQAEELASVHNLNPSRGSLIGISELATSFINIRTGSIVTQRWMEGAVANQLVFASLSPENQCYAVMSGMCCPLSEIVLPKDRIAAERVLCTAKSLASAAVGKVAFRGILPKGARCTTPRHVYETLLIYGQRYRRKLVNMNSGRPSLHTAAADKGMETNLTNATHESERKTLGYPKPRTFHAHSGETLMRVEERFSGHPISAANPADTVRKALCSTDTLIEVYQKGLSSIRRKAVCTRGFIDDSIAPFAVQSTRHTTTLISMLRQKGSPAREVAVRVDPDKGLSEVVGSGEPLRPLKGVCYRAAVRGMPSYYGLSVSVGKNDPLHGIALFIPLAPAQPFTNTPLTGPSLTSTPVTEVTHVSPDLIRALGCWLTSYVDTAKPVSVIRNLCTFGSASAHAHILRKFAAEASASRQNSCSTKLVLNSAKRRPTRKDEHARNLKGCLALGSASACGAGLKMVLASGLLPSILNHGYKCSIRMGFPSWPDGGRRSEDLWEEKNSLVSCVPALEALPRLEDEGRATFGLDSFRPGEASESLETEILDVGDEFKFSSATVLGGAPGAAAWIAHHEAAAIGWVQSFKEAPAILSAIATSGGSAEALHANLLAISPGIEVANIACMLRHAMLASIDLPRLVKVAAGHMRSCMIRLEPLVHAVDRQDWSTASDRAGYAQLLLKPCNTEEWHDTGKPLPLTRTAMLGAIPFISHYIGRGEGSITGASLCRSKIFSLNGMSMSVLSKDKVTVTISHGQRAGTTLAMAFKPWRKPNSSKTKQNK